MRRFIVIGVAALAMLAFAGSVAAANAHYVGPKTPAFSVDSSTGGLVVDFKAAGYGSGESVDYSASFDYVITWGCVTPPKSNEPSGLASTSDSLDVSGILTASRTGTLSGPLTLFGGTSFSCPSHNMTRVLISASYTNIMFTLDGTDPFGPAEASYSR